MQYCNIQFPEMVPSREIIDDTAVVNDGTAAVNQRTTSYCESVVDSTDR